MTRRASLAAFAAIVLTAVAAGSQRAASRPRWRRRSPTAAPARPFGSIDLATREGVALVQGQWRYSDTQHRRGRLHRAGRRRAADRPPVKTYDYTPQAGGAGFDDSAWPVIDPTTLAERRGTAASSSTGIASRSRFPSGSARFDPTARPSCSRPSLDDYAEIWVDGELPRALGQTGGSVVGGLERAQPPRDRTRRPAGPAESSSRCSA